MLVDNQSAFLLWRLSMTTYSLKVLNTSGFNKNYVLFMEPPIVTSSGGQAQVYTNAWVTFSGVNNNSVDSVTYTDETFAYWAKATVPIGPGSMMGQSGFAPANAGTKDSVSFFGATSDGGIGFGPPTSPGQAAAGSIEIIAGTDFNKSNSYVFGLARPGKIPHIPSPVATFVATPNDSFNITPVIKFYVADGTYAPGSIIDVTTASTKAGSIDFTGMSETTAVATQQPDGSFSINYY